MRKLTAPLSPPDRHSGIFSSVANENIRNPPPQRRKLANIVASDFVAGDSESRSARSGMTVWTMGGWLLLLMILFSQCARPFQPLALETRSYSQSASAPAAASKGLQVSYDTFGILEVSNNRRYVKKVRKQNLKFLPIKLTSSTADTVVVDRADLQTFGEYEMIATPSLNRIPHIQQVSWPYLLFILGDFSLSSTLLLR